MEIGDEIYTERYIAEIVDVRGNDMYGIDFNSRDGRERNYNLVSIHVIEDMIAQKEWYVDNDPFKD